MTSRERLGLLLVFVIGCAEGVADPIDADDAAVGTPDASPDRADAAQRRDAGREASAEDAAPEGVAPIDANAVDANADAAAPDAAAPDAAVAPDASASDGGAVCTDSAHVNQLVILLGAHATIASCPCAAGQCCTAFGTVQGCVAQ